MDAFDDTKYTGNPEFNWDEEEGYEGIMEIYEPHISRVIEQNKKFPKTVWTIFDGDDGEILIEAGFHYENRIQYFISNEEWNSADEIYIWFE